MEFADAACVFVSQVIERPTETNAGEEAEGIGPPVKLGANDYLGKHPCSCGVAQGSFWGWLASVAEEHMLHLRFADDAAEFLHRDEHHHEHCEKNQNRPGAGKHEFLPRMRVGCVKTKSLEQTLDEWFQIKEEHGAESVKQGLPEDVTNQRPARKSINEGNKVNQQQDFCDNETAYQRFGYARDFNI